ncbi:phage protein NinX family protein [Xenorhabdus lircayensis]|uniref:DUF2591 family protein n=1 Tax=Xenorhabdus lircayensis TaxID=2763499 RepID=A0ABS0UA00_9GAMM|nr:phage protein NinX family protein [Xenorhabdus lircayensis]MBI6550711.1 DUF2591 family protein [Xenorhabdus lircayensis]
MKLKTSELTGRALDWAVALAADAKSVECSRIGDYLLELPNSDYFFATGDWYTFRPSTDWAPCGQLIDIFRMEITNVLVNDVWKYYATCPHLMGEYQHGNTPKLAICRAVVAAQLGDEVEIPDMLLEGK